MINNFKKLAIGLLIVGFFTVVIAGASLVAVEREKRITGLANVATLDYCKIISLSKLFGEPLLNPYPPEDCNAPDPLDVQKDVSTAALTLGGISIASGGLLLFVIHRRPELLSERRLKNVFAGFGNKKDSLEVKIRSLDKLRRDGLLSDKEFEEQKRKALSETSTSSVSVRSQPNIIREENELPRTDSAQVRSPKPQKSIIDWLKEVEK